MRKVIFDPAILKSEQPMAELIYRLQVQEENYFLSRKVWDDLKYSGPMPKATSYEIYMENLLRPPDIEFVEFNEEKPDDPTIFISTAEDVGSINIFVSVWDNEGNLIESAEAFYITGSGTEWAFTILEELPSRTPLNVCVKAMDCVGGVRVKHCRLIMP